MRQGAPIRFLALMLGGWTCLRLATLAPGWWSGNVAEERPSIAAISDAPASPETPPPTGYAAVEAPVDQPGIARGAAFPALPQIAFHSRRGSFLQPANSFAAPAWPRRSAPAPRLAPPLFAPIVHASAQTPFQPLPPAPEAARRARRWSGSAWLLARRDGGAALAPGGTLGGSQAGARLLYRLNDDPRRPLALSGRVYAPLRRTAGAEAAIGLDWRPSARIPVHLLVERRQRIGREGRSAFSATVYGGGSADLGRGWRLDAYAQAGIVGTRSRDLFVDASARVSRPVGPVEVGGAVWGAAQPGASRLDVGPHVTLPIRTSGATLRLSAEYRFRIAGDARPASGPALTLGVDF